MRDVGGGQGTADRGGQGAEAIAHGVQVGVDPRVVGQHGGDGVLGQAGHPGPDALQLDGVAQRFVLGHDGPAAQAAHAEVLADGPHDVQVVAQGRAQPPDAGEVGPLAEDRQAVDLVGDDVDAAVLRPRDQRLDLVAVADLPARVVGVGQQQDRRRPSGIGAGAVEHVRGQPVAVLGPCGDADDFQAGPGTEVGPEAGVGRCGHQDAVARVTEDERHRLEHRAGTRQHTDVGGVDRPTEHAPADEPGDRLAEDLPAGVGVVADHPRGHRREGLQPRPQQVEHLQVLRDGQADVPGIVLTGDVGVDVAGEPAREHPVPTGGEGHPRCRVRGSAGERGRRRPNGWACR